MTIRLIGNEQLKLRLGALKSPRTARAVASAVGKHLQAVTAPYPGESGANTPPGLNGYSWYVRGYGVRTTTDLGYPTSEDLINRWDIGVRGNGAVVRNTASYAAYVHDQDEQAGFHGDRGWRTWQAEFKKRRREFKRIQARALEQQLR